MSDLVDFLLARIAEDEEVARRVRPDEYLSTRDDRELWAGEGGGYAHVAITSGRILAECKAKRRIVRGMASVLQESRTSATQQARTNAEATLQDLASIYADHPGFREEWRV